MGSRPWPSVSTDELEYGVPLFLTQLSETLRLEATDTPFPAGAVGTTAAIVTGWAPPQLLLSDRFVADPWAPGALDAGILHRPLGTR